MIRSKLSMRKIEYIIATYNDAINRIDGVMIRAFVVMYLMTRTSNIFRVLGVFYV